MTSSDDCLIKAWRPQHENFECMQTLSGHADFVHCICILSNDQVASGSDDTTIKIWHLFSGECVRTLRGHSGWINDLVSIENENMKCLASCSEDTLIKIWSIRDGICLFTLEGHLSWVNRIRYASQHHLLISASSDKSIKLWSLFKEKKCFRTLNGHKAYVSCLIIIPNTFKLISGSLDETIKIWHATIGKCVYTLKGHNSWVNCLDLTANANEFISCSNDFTLKIWDHIRGVCLKTISTQSLDSNIECMTLMPNAVNLEICLGNQMGQMQLLNVKHKSSFGSSIQAHTSSIMCLVLSNRETKCDQVQKQIIVDVFETKQSNGFNCCWLFL